MSTCEVCFRHCDIPEGGKGFCGARICENGAIRPANYGRITGLALDPIEKKPLRRFFPGSMILKSRGNMGLAFTYNEPLIGWEFVRDTSRMIRAAGLKTVLVTNGTAELTVLEALAPYIDAMNIDLKGFTEHYYSEVLCGSLNMVKAFIARAVQICHVELTALIVPGENDSEEEMRAMTAWISSLKDTGGGGHEIPLHISRFFPRFHMTDRPATDVKAIYHLAEIAQENLRYVYTGNC